MTKKTDEFIKTSVQALYEKKAILFTGGAGVGKTYLAKKVANELVSPQYCYFSNGAPQDVRITIVSCNNNYSYEDFVGGISISIENKKLSFDYEDKLLIEILKEAAASFDNRENII